MRVEKTVFISYRRTNVYHAISVYQNLQMHGYDVFWDYESIGAGDFEQIILSEIAARAHFVVILTPSALKRCGEPDDWLRREIEHAIDLKRNIIPLMFDKFEFGKSKKFLDGKLAVLSRFNGLEISPRYFRAAMLQLQEDYLNQPLKAILYPAPPENAAEVERKKEIADGLPAPTEEQLTAEQYFERAVNRSETDFDGQFADYTKALRLNPQLTEAYFNRGNAQAKIEDYGGAIADYGEALRLNPNDALVYFNRGKARAEIEDYGGAIADYGEVLRLNPKDAEAYFSRAWARYQIEDYRGAIADYGEVLRLNPKRANSYYLRGSARIKIGDYTGAIADYGEFLRFNPKDDEAYLSRARARYQIRDYTGVIADCGEALRFNPKNTEAYLSRAWAFYIKRDYMAALKDLAEIVHLNQQNDRLYNTLGLIYDSMGDYIGAIENYNEALRLNSEEATTYFNRGVAFHRQGDHINAITDYKHAIQIFIEMNRLNPEEPTILASLAITYYLLNDISQAVALWRELITRDDRYKYAGWTGRKFGWRPELIEELKKLIAKL